MRKLLAIVLALALALSMATVAFAATITNETPDLTDSSSEVKIKINNGTLPENPGDIDPEGPDADDIVYKVDIDASGAIFEYTFDANYNADTHQYEGGSWDELSKNIVVTNHSNTGIDVTSDFKDNDGLKYGVQATLTTDELNLASAVNTTNGVSGNLVVEIDGAIPTVFEGTYTLDYVTVTIAAASHN